MNKRKYLALFLCALFLLNATLGGMLAENMEADPNQPLTTVEETLPPADPPREPLPQATEAPKAELMPAPEQEPVSDTTEEPQPEVTPEPVLDPTEEPLPDPTESLIDNLVEEPLAALEEIPQIERKASKELLVFESNARSAIGTRTVSSLNMWVTVDTDYINLNDGAREITWNIETEGGTGSLQYAFDVYKNGVCVEYMPAYVSGNTYSYTPTEPGIYRVKAFVYEWDTEKELIHWSWDTGVSAMSIDSLTVLPEHPAVGDLLTWTMGTTGGTGAIKYSYEIYYGYTYSFLTSSGSVNSNSYSYRVSLPGTYLMIARVWEVDITDSSELYIISEIEVIGEPTLIVNSVSADKNNANIDEDITWTVDAIGAVGTVEYEFHVYAEDVRIESTDWGTDNSYKFKPKRNGYYRVEVSVRDSDFPDKLYTEKSKIVSVPGFCFNFLTVDKTTAYVGDTVTWKVDFSGGGDWFCTNAGISLDGNVYDYVCECESNTVSYLFIEPGYYSIDIYLDVPYDGKIYCDSTNLTVRERPAPLNLVTAAVSGSSIKVTWNAVTGATGYELSLSTSKTGEYTSVYTGTARAYTNTGRVAGTIYYYKVRAYNTVWGEKLFGASSLSTAGIALAKPATPSAVSLSKKSAKVTWTAVQGAGGYELWRSTSPSGVYTRVYRGTAKTFTNTGLTSGKTYYYKVKAYKLNGSVSLYGPFSAYRAIKSK